MNKGTLALYACGGFGTNIGKHFEADAGKDNPGHAVTTPYYIDTSRSNLDSSVPEERVFLLEGVDGSGKVRRSNHAAIAENVRLILQKFTPQDFNIVTFSLSGGSGSVFGPLLLAELLKRGHSAVAVVVGSDESAIAAENTLNSLKSLESLAAKNGVPFVVAYEHNVAGRKQSEVNRQCQSRIGALSVLVSRQNHGLDTTDIANWVNYTNTTAVPARLAVLDVFLNQDGVSTIDQPIAVASLYEDRDAEHIVTSADYVTDGYMKIKLDYLSEAHFVISLGSIPSTVKKLQARIEELQRAKQARVVHASLLGDTETTDDGMVL